MKISPEDPANASSDRLPGPGGPCGLDSLSVKTAIGPENPFDASLGRGGKRASMCRPCVALLIGVTIVVLLSVAWLLLLHYRHGITEEEEVVPAGNSSDWCPVEVRLLNDTLSKLTLGDDARIIPCASAGDYNEEVMRRVNEGLRAAESTKGADGKWKASSEGGEHAFMKQYLQFVLAVANVGSKTLPLAQLEGLFKEEFGLLKCLGTEQLSIEDLRFACSAPMVDLPIGSALFTDTLQSKAMLVALSLGDYRDALQEFVGRRKGIWEPVPTPFDAFFDLVKSKDYQGMAAFLDDPARHGESLRQMYTDFFHHWRAHCFVDSKPKETRDWEWSSHFTQCFRSTGSDLVDEEFTVEKERMHKEEMLLKEWKKKL